MDKYSLEKEYGQLVREYRLAHNEIEQWDARNRMARIERIAGESYGFEFADHLHQLLDDRKN